MALFHHPFSWRLAALTVGVASMAGCLNRPLETGGPILTTVVSEKLPRSRVDKIDLLLMIDNSPSMADKQAILADAVPDLVKGLASPPCLDAQGIPYKYFRVDREPTADEWIRSLNDDVWITPTILIGDPNDPSQILREPSDEELDAAIRR